MASLTSARPARADVPTEWTWDLQSIFAAPEAFEAAFAAVAGALDELRGYEGRLASSGAVLADFLERRETVGNQLEHLCMQPELEFAADTSREDSAGRAQRAIGLASRFSAAIAFAEPELVAAGMDAVTALVDAEPRLARYAHHLDRLRRRAAHLRSPEVEDLLATVAEPFASARQTGELLADAEIRFEPAVGADGRRFEVAAATVESLLMQPDRALRASAWHSYADGYLALRQTLASHLHAVTRQNIFLARSRRYGSALEAKLDPDAIPVAVYENVVDSFRRHVHVWHRAFEIRRRALGVERIAPYDVLVPLNRWSERVPYEQAVEWVLAAVEPLGSGYVEAMRRGILEERWIDVYPTVGKRPGAFSAGTAGTKPFICLNYTEDLRNASILAHELGHSMHSLLTWGTQPLVYGGYSTFVAEVASNVNQALMRAHLLAGDPDRELAIAVIDEALSNFHRYLFVMPTLARLEREVHVRAEAGEAVTASTLGELTAGFFAEAFGSEVELDAERVGVTWAQYGHLSYSFYVFQYSTGIAGANALASRVLAGEPGAADDVLQFLRSGSSDYPIDVLRRAGVDLTTAEPLDRAFAVLSGYVDRLEQLLGERDAAG